MPEYKRLNTLAEVREQTGLSKPTIYKMIHAGTFPPPVRIGTKAVRWRYEDLMKWEDGLTDFGIAAKDFHARGGFAKAQSADAA